MDDGIRGICDIHGLVSLSTVQACIFFYVVVSQSVRASLHALRISEVERALAMDITVDTTKTLEQLESSDWGEPDFDSYLVTTIYQLRRKPLSQLTVEDLRIMIGQQIGLRYLVPLAIKRLKDDPLVAGDFHRGDLLKNVLSVEPNFWREHTDLYREADMILGELEIPRDTITHELMRAAELFKAGKPLRCPTAEY